MLNCIIIFFSSAMVFSSGLACTSAITQMLQVGDHIVSMNDVYGGMSEKLILAIYH
jgi:O-acetylhomoserine/O-acetylserine sulfhydrylase-like pyridoxal-dependent enzyme